MKFSPYARLTVWYVAILMALSLAFSVWVYSETSSEVRSGLEGPVVTQFQNSYGYLPRGFLRDILDQQYANTRGRIIVRLILLNAGVLVVGAAASYWLARRTMKPIEDALEAQNRFTADASHELRTPLAAMKTEIEVTLRDPKVEKSELKELLQSNLEEIDRLGALSQSLLTLARPGETPHLMAMRTKGVVADVCKHLKPLADAKKITINCDDTDFKVMSDAKSVESILGILLDNAIKYSPAKTAITISSQRRDAHIYIKVADQGQGIKAQDLPQIFDRFYRADTSRNQTQSPGNGLGLAIAQKAARSIRAQLTAESKPGKGSTFTLRLPTAQ